MHFKFNRLSGLLCVLCAMFMAMPAFSNDEPLSAIKGKVLTGEGTPVAYVAVQIKEKNKGTMTNENGEFVFKRLHAGHYTLQVILMGYQSVTKEVDLTDDQILNVSIQLEATNQQLQEIIVSSNRNKYKTDGVSSTLRLKTRLLDIPQNIQVISSSLIADQQTFDIVDGITRNVSGATRVGHWDNQYAQIRMRGSKIPAFRNGMNIEASWGPTAEDAAMIDRIEFVKGPAGFMLSAGEPGGFYNVVTKKPTGVTQGSVNLSMGSFSTYRAALDFDGKLSKDGKLLYRLNMAGQQKDFYTKYNYSNRYMIAPVLKYLVDDKTSITLEYTFQGSRYLGNGNYQFSAKKLADEDISNDFFYGDPSLEPGRLKDHSVYVYLDHKLNDRWDAHAQVAYFNFSMVANSVWANSVTQSGDMDRYFSIGDEAGENKFGQVSLSGEEYTGNVRHRILAGIDMGNKKFWGDFRTLDQSLGLRGGQKFNVYNPVYGIPFDSIPTIDRSRSVRTRAGASAYISSVNYTSAYAQDELAFFNDRLRLTMAVRFTHSETVGQTKAASLVNNTVTPRIGLSYSINKSTSVYALYDQSFVPQTGLDSNLQAFQPVKGNDIEAGIKKEWFGGRWVSSLTAYRILRENAKVSLGIKDSRGADVVEALGQTESKGIEADISGEILPGLNVNVNYAYTYSKVARDASNKTEANTTVGNLTPNTAAHVTNAWLSYRIGKGPLTGFGASAGMQWLADRTYGTTRTFNMPNYFRTDAGLNYSKGKYNISFLVNNLADNRKLLTAASFSAGYYSYIVEARRNFRMTVAYRF
ncbi:iron complex outermembrane recepter protein [Chitinophaga sp. CF118]|uniref:TonB-dependent receptor n=1 Tax=Chitinophaga sp. CF118 TaxID=1884367 RepID=UPI0008F22C87|nr:TonB-dependent receptor [Chitinophaga sp. CF118]SFD63197.1 iron complex outermembrane recepter protein [Chitinophaga sp. CF118]